MRGALALCWWDDGTEPLFPPSFSWLDDGGWSVSQRCAQPRFQHLALRVMGLVDTGPT